MSKKKIAFVVTDGFEQVEHTRPWDEAKKAGYQPVLLTPGGDTIQGYHHLDAAETFQADGDVAEADAEDYAALVLPGGVANPDALRMDADAMRFIRAFIKTGRPVAAICHGPWTLVEADAIRGKRLTSWPSLKTDIENAGGTWADEECVQDGQFITSRKPDDLDAFCTALMRTLEDEPVAQSA